MKIYKFIGGPKDGEEIVFTNARHPKRIHFATPTHYHEYAATTVEEFELEDSMITYRHTATRTREDHHGTNKRRSG